jgi:hypothetical protein
MQRHWAESITFPTPQNAEPCFADAHGVRQHDIKHRL